MSGAAATGILPLAALIHPVCQSLPDVLSSVTLVHPVRRLPVPPPRRKENHTINKHQILSLARPLSDILSCAALVLPVHRPLPDVLSFVAIIHPVCQSLPDVLSSVTLVHPVRRL